MCYVLPDTSSQSASQAVVISHTKAREGREQFWQSLFIKAEEDCDSATLIDEGRNILLGFKTQQYQHRGMLKSMMDPQSPQDGHSGIFVSLRDD